MRYIDFQAAGRISDEIQNEFARATKKHGAFNSAHEGFAVLKEEVDELWDEVKKNGSVRDYAKLRAEAVQIGAMAMRFIYDVC